MGVIYYTSLMNIKDGITGEQVKLILGGMKNQELFLWNMRLVWNLPVKLNRKGVEVLDISKIGNVTECIVKNWEYVSCRDMLRNMYVLSDKYFFMGALASYLVLGVSFILIAMSFFMKWRSLKIDPLTKVSFVFGQVNGNACFVNIFSQFIFAVYMFDVFEFEPVFLPQIHE